ncbi:hypothetical protein CEP48_00345 [Mergibacter septicus]|uniref:Uncharacterized protein n=1 Tax=Mergibacter septicus TaxID=221402 RepID=A0A8D4J138_9PAST|nr:hypothetical protein [Mergibacter septicus]AWX14730.1 hypothetical protein CEP47_00345 [Mergibacter septicus]QDJ13981.1 hypothetical protein CEP48_00345 [Mergibacter septicus]UTU48570.1 hypothetical protein HLL31_07285 [Mergibacter septicus]WMR95801.1 hypothetical protein RDJ12_07715 [Mergibacter septicus]
MAEKHIETVTISKKHYENLLKSANANAVLSYIAIKYLEYVQTDQITINQLKIKEAFRNTNIMVNSFNENNSNIFYEIHIIKENLC